MRSNDPEISLAVTSVSLSFDAKMASSSYSPHPATCSEFYYYHTVVDHDIYIPDLPVSMHIMEDSVR
jgi:hypothetical protein